MSEPSSDERRVHPRRASDLPATLTTEGRSMEGVVENIGEGGVFFATETLEFLLDHGTQVVVDFACQRGDKEERHTLPGTILRTERYFDGTKVVRAFAVKFDELFDLEGVSLAN